MENLLSIGEFAAASQLSHKALRLYAERGLLSSEHSGKADPRHNSGSPRRANA
jgi:DNA-binding transcriptional MerR regulator